MYDNETFDVQQEIVLKIFDRSIDRVAKNYNNLKFFLGIILFRYSLIFRCFNNGTKQYENISMSTII